MFWSDTTLRERLKDEGLILPFREDRIDCAAYTLAVGSDLYVSPNELEAEPARVTVEELATGQCFAIPPGQFAFLVTEESVAVPTDALALISIRAKVKFRGLVNVSGFHVDPGYHGQLTFAVFNAGPVSVHLRQGEPIFLIWYANLDQEVKGRDRPTARGIDMSVIAGIAGQVPSFAGLAKSIADLKERLHSVEKRQRVVQTLLALAAGGLVTWFFRELM